MNVIDDKSDPGKRYNYRFFDMSYKNEDTENAVEGLVREAVLKNLGLRDVFLFCAHADDAIHNYTDITEDGTYRLSFIVDPLKVYPKLPKRAFFEVEYPTDAAVAEAGFIAEKIKEKMLELVPSYKDAPDIAINLYNSNLVIDRDWWVTFTMPRDQFRKLAVQLNIEKEFDRIIARDDARRAKAQEHLDAANKVLENRLPEGCRILKIKEYTSPSQLEFTLSQPIKVSELKISSTIYDSTFFFNGEDRGLERNDDLARVASDIVEADKEFAKELGLTKGNDINLISDCGIYRETFTILGSTDVRKFYADVEDVLKARDIEFGLKALQPPTREDLGGDMTEFKNGKPAALIF